MSTAVSTASKTASPLCIQSCRSGFFPRTAITIHSLSLICRFKPQLRLAGSTLDPDNHQHHAQQLTHPLDSITHFQQQQRVKLPHTTSSSSSNTADGCFEDCQHPNLLFTNHRLPQWCLPQSYFRVWSLHSLTNLIRSPEPGVEFQPACLPNKQQ